MFPVWQCLLTVSIIIIMVHAVILAAWTESIEYIAVFISGEVERPAIDRVGQ